MTPIIYSSLLNMKFFLKLLLVNLIEFFSYSIRTSIYIFFFSTCSVLNLCALEEINLVKEEVLNKISGVVHPNMAKIWKTFFSNFDQDKIVRWSFSEKTGAFSIILKSPLKFWVPASKANSAEPRPGSILIFGINNKVEGRLNSEKKSMEFTTGFNIYCRYKMGFLTIPIMVDVYNFTYKNEDLIILEAGKAGISEKRNKSLEKYLVAWENKEHVVQGDYEAFLKLKSK